MNTSIKIKNNTHRFHLLERTLLTSSGFKERHSWEKYFSMTGESSGWLDHKNFKLEWRKKRKIWLKKNKVWVFFPQLFLCHSCSLASISLGNVFYSYSNSLDGGSTGQSGLWGWISPFGASSSLPSWSSAQTAFMRSKSTLFKAASGFSWCCAKMCPREEREEKEQSKQHVELKMLITLLL